MRMSPAERAANMSCCAVGCTNRFDKNNKTRKFYRIPSTRTPFKANKRRLWLQAIRRSDWNEQMIKNASICSDHFISGEASDDIDSPDFVPSIFPYSIQPGKDGVAKLERYKRKRRRDATPSRCPEDGHQCTPSSISPTECGIEAGADLYNEGMVPKTVHDDLQLKYSQLHTECDNLREDINKLKTENEQ
ncbi:THAP domain-containing protein 1 A-like [Cyprinodon tularosa]|uniref:THAP domain-containing protein 1 A-like n=1 Tax=Cyprinodon tularosa TaxID=77115 RepID=UPI0018E24300|nr:THAP domain-containing protein 1 A-like [Cyprinodon tularosa]XP_038147574.1 THAP domain-containing protein 1 A-like [Cyprinodon tularosa]XP_038157631.1 THAP domain-containing protein 1 A-like [Cyprinodon tularosa]